MDELFFKVGENIIELESIDSTNNYLSKLISTTNVPNGTVILAHNQTNGRGQRQNSWVSDPGKNLIVSIFIQFNGLPVKENFYISMIAANACSKIISKRNNCEIKWPNDILLNSKKVGGILIENTLQGKFIKHSVIGIGLNVNQISFNKLPFATSIYNETNKQLDIKILVKELMDEVSKQYYLIQTNQYQKVKSDYLNNLYGYKRTFIFKEVETNCVKNGLILDVKSNGTLQIESEQNILEYQFKEIIFLFN